MTELSPLHPDEQLTQYVFGGSDPYNAPRPTDTDGLSLLRGALSTREAARFVRRFIRKPQSGDGVRYAMVSDLRAAGFRVEATATRNIPIHVSVSAEEEWDTTTCEKFATCFTEVMDVQPKEGENGE